MRSASSLAGLLLVTSPYSCHKPTPQEEYADAKHCHAVLDTSLKAVSAARFAQSRLDPSLVKLASDDDLTAAYEFGKQLGSGFDAVTRDAEQERVAYLRSHGGAQDFDALRSDVNGCLADYYGRSND